MYQRETFGPVTAGAGLLQKGRMSMPVYVYYVDGLLIDTGARVLGDGLRRFLADLPPVERVVLTHLHEDHCGMAAPLAAEGIPIYCHPEYVEAAGAPLRFAWYRRTLSGRPEPFPAQPLGLRVETEHYTFHVIPTPGHAPDHIALYEPDRGWLFSGDLFLGTKVVTVTRHESMPLLMESIARVLELDFQELFCAHAGRVEGGKEALRAKLQALERIQGEVHRLAALGWSPGKVARRLFPGYWYKPLTLISLGEHSSAHIVRSFWPR
ncbi:MAG TPA: MBL fold metallo-hydrolase [Sphingobacteriaceae bacterium]|nr:MBL fold metallo-hydrolase [Sphingobacteriaceae bacterium]